VENSRNGSILGCPSCRRHPHWKLSDPHHGSGTGPCEPGFLDATARDAISRALAQSARCLARPGLSRGRTVLNPDPFRSISHSVKASRSRRVCVVSLQPRGAQRRGCSDAFRVDLLRSRGRPPGGEPMLPCGSKTLHWTDGLPRSGGPGRPAHLPPQVGLIASRSV
jgi:hypothetical protein